MTMYEKEQWRALIDTAVDGIISASADGIITVYNPAAERIFGHTAADAVGQDVALLMPPHYANAHTGYMDHYLASGDAKIIGIGREVEGKRADGSVFPMHLSVGEYSTVEGRQFVAIIRDLSEEMAERTRRQTLQDQLELIGRHAAVSEMGAALAHELNQPLTAIDLFLSAAETQLRDDPERALKTFARVRQEAQRAGNIVRRIREMVERSDGERSTFHLAPVIDSALELCRLVDRHDATIKAIPSPPALLFGDPTQVRMILVNLVKNALDASEDLNDPKVLIRVSVTEKARIEVLDNGPGLDPSVEDQVFEPFSSTKTDGLGIGLSICQTLAEAHGGRLFSVPADQQTDGLGGAMFVLELPLTEGQDRG